MKKIIYLLTALVVFAGCSKTEVQKAEETYKVNFEVSIDALLSMYGKTYDDLTINIDALEYDADKVLVNTQQWADARQGKSHTFTADSKSKYYVLRIDADFKVSKKSYYLAKVFYVGTDEEVTIEDSTLTSGVNPIK